MINKERSEEALTPFDREYLYDKNFYKKHNMGTETIFNKYFFS